ncbi:MAG TPA: O-antigen ligase family protein [Nitrospira sp.]|nr:O-antigen ligase family protein [Nitrospira sp.]
MQSHHRYTSVTTLPDELPTTASPVRLFPFLGRPAEWILRQWRISGLGGFGAIAAGLAIFSPLIDGGSTQVPVLVIRLVLLAGGLIWLLGRMKAGEFFVPQTRLDVSVVLFAGWAILSLSWAPYKNASLQWVLSILSYVAFFAMVTQGIRSQAQIWIQVSVVTAVGVFEAVLGLAQYLSIGEARARGTFFSPNFFAAYQAAIFLLSLGVLLYTKRELLPAPFRRWLWCAAAVSLAAVVTAQSRGVAAALVGAAVFLGVSRYGKKALVVVGLCLVAVLVVPNPLQHRMYHADAQDPYAYMRLEIWKSALIRLADHPLGIGVGMFKQGSFQERFPIEGEIVRYRKRPESAHNEYLQIGVELGVVGLALFVCMAGLWAAEVRQLLREPGDTIDRGLAMGLAASVLVLLLHAAMDSSFHEPALVLLLVLLGALVHALYLLARPHVVTWRRIGFCYHPLRAAYVVAGALIMAAVCAQSAVAWYAHEQGKRHAVQADLEGAFAWYARAAAIDPGTTGYHDSIARTAIQLYSDSGAFEWLLKAEEEETIARTLNPMDARFAYRLGSVYGLMASQALTSARRSELLAKASDSYAEAIRLDPYLPFSYFELAQLRVGEGRVEDAIELLSTATVHEPNFLPGRALRAELALRAGIPGDYGKEMAAITDIRSRYEQQMRDEIERQFMNVDLYPLARALAMRTKS